MEVSKEMDGGDKSQRYGLDPYSIAAGMLRNDALLLVPLCAALALPVWIPELIGRDQSTVTSSYLISDFVPIDRLVQLLVSSFVVLRWRGLLANSKNQRDSALIPTLRIVAIGLILWSLLLMPVWLATSGSGAWTAPLSAFLIVIGVFWSLRLYFYFATFGLLRGGFRDVYRQTVALTRQDPSASLRSMISPLAIAVLVWGLFLVPSPDGRSLFWSTCAACSSQFFWILATYSGLSVTIVSLDDSAWRSAGLDPYRKERLQTLEMQGRKSRFNWLSPRGGFKILVLAVVLMVANLVQGLNLVPAVQIKIDRVEIANRRVTLLVELIDVQHHFRGFSPYAFSLATKTGFAISSGIAKVSLAARDVSISADDLRGSGPVALRLEFNSNKSEEALKALDNMYLWYNLKPLFLVKAQ